jgi:hypothetical protein
VEADVTKLEARLVELRQIRENLLADYNKANGAVLAYEEILYAEPEEATAE